MLPRFVSASLQEQNLSSSLWERLTYNNTLFIVYIVSVSRIMLIVFSGFPLYDDSDRFKEKKNNSNNLRRAFFVLLMSFAHCFDDFELVTFPRKRGGYKKVQMYLLA